MHSLELMMLQDIGMTSVQELEDLESTRSGTLVALVPFLHVSHLNKITPKVRENKLPDFFTQKIRLWVLSNLLE